MIEKLMISRGMADMYRRFLKRISWGKGQRRVRSGEEGSVLVIALIMLVLLTLVGTSANQISSVEIQIAGNEAVYKNNFYLAEASALQAIQALENTNLDTSPPSWLENTPGELTDAQVRTDANWSGTFPGGTPSATSAVDTNARYVAVSEGIDSTSSLDMGKSRVYSYKVYGRSNTNNGQVTILVGYRKAF